MGPVGSAGPGTELVGSWANREAPKNCSQGQEKEMGNPQPRAS